MRTIKALGWPLLGLLLLLAYFGGGIWYLVTDKYPATTSGYHGFGSGMLHGVFAGFTRFHYLFHSVHVYWQPNADGAYYAGYVCGIGSLVLVGVTVGVIAFASRN